mgnify:CR=1 FL=1
MNYGKIDGVCNGIEPFTGKYACAIGKKLNIKDYRITIDADPIDNTVYFELGFDDSHDYDTSMYIDSIAACELASKLDQIANCCSDEHDKVVVAEDALAIMIDYLKDGIVTKCEITVLDGYHETVFDTMFGKLIINIVFYYDMPVDIESEIHDNECEICMISTKRYHKKSKTYFKSFLEERINTLKKDYENLNTEFVINLDKYNDIYNAMQDTIKKDGMGYRDDIVDAVPKNIDMNKMVSDYLSSRKSK